MYTTTKHLPYLRPQQHKQQQQTVLYQQPHHSNIGRQPVLNQQQQQRQFTQQLEFHSRQISPSTLMMRHSGQK